MPKRERVGDKGVEIYPRPLSNKQSDSKRDFCAEIKNLSI